MQPSDNEISYIINDTKNWKGDDLCSLIYPLKKLKKIQEYLTSNKMTSDALSMLQAARTQGIELRDDELRSLISTNAERRYSL